MAILSFLRNQKDSATIYKEQAKSSKPVLEALSLKPLPNPSWEERVELRSAPAFPCTSAPERFQGDGQLPASARSTEFTDMQHMATSTSKVWSPSMRSTIAVPHLLLGTA